MKTKQPFVRIVRRTDFPLWAMIIINIAAVLVAVGIGAILLAAIKVDPFVYYKDMFTIGTIDNRFAYKNFEGLIEFFVPLLITSLALALTFKMKFWNIGGEGQFIMGAISSATVALLLGNSLPSWLTLIMMAVCGAASAGIYGLVVAFFKVKWGTNETLMTLMLNYIALYALKYFGETQAGWNFFLSGESVRPVFATFPESAWMYTIKIGKFSLNITLVIAILLCALIYIYMKKTKHGYEISVVGDSQSTAKYAGMKVGRIVMRTMFLSAALIGLAGTFYVSTAHSLSTSVTNNVGWTGIIVAWLSRLNPVMILVTSLLISVLRVGCQTAATNFPVIDSNFADLLQGIILFTVLMADFLTRFKIVFRKNTEKEVEDK